MPRRGAWLGPALCAGLAGCGFQLADSAGTATRIEQASVRLVGGAAGFRQALAGSLRGGGVRVLSGSEEADLTVHLDGPQERHQVIGLTADMDAREYEVGLHLTARLQRPGEEPSAPLRLSRYRHWLFDSGEYLAADEERAMLKQELGAELIEALLLRIRAYAVE